MTSRRPASDTAPREIAFFAADVPDKQTLIDGLRPGVAHHVLSPDGDGLAEMATHLAGYREVDVLHIVSHGAPGRVFLGNSEINLGSVASHSRTIDNIRRVLAWDGKVFVYGCEVAKGHHGQTFLVALQKALDVPVVASVTGTGANSENGDWHLHHIGMQGARYVPFRELLAHTQALSAYKGLLMPSFSFDTATDGTDVTETVNGVTLTATDDDPGGTEVEILASLDGHTNVVAPSNRVNASKFSFDTPVDITDADFALGGTSESAPATFDVVPNSGSLVGLSPLYSQACCV